MKKITHISVEIFELFVASKTTILHHCVLNNENQRVKVNAGRLGEEDGQRKLEMTRVKLEMGEIYAQNVRKNEEIQGLKDKVFGLETEKGKLREIHGAPTSLRLNCSRCL